MHGAVNGNASTSLNGNNSGFWNRIVNDFQIRSGDNDGSSTSKDNDNDGDKDHGKKATSTPPIIRSTVITSENPTSGPIGTSVTLTGTGFTSNDIVYFGAGTVSNTPASASADGTVLTFAVPQDIGPYCKPGTPCPYFRRLVTPGTYEVSVMNASTSARSNSVAFTVTKSATTTPPTPSPLSIASISAPTNLLVGTEGTWTVNVDRPSDATGNLTYSVKWGDEPAIAAAMSALLGNNGTTQASATFTHTYESAGTFTPIFTVTDSNGHSVKASASVVVNAQ